MSVFELLKTQMQEAAKVKVSKLHIQGGWGGWPTGNGKKLSGSLAKLGQATCLAVA